MHYDAERPKLSDPAHEDVRLQPEREGQVRCSAWLDHILRKNKRHGFLNHGICLEQ